MAVLHRALLSWFLGLVFLILLVIRLDQRTQWNWFIVFIPMWIFDGSVLTYVGFYVVNKCKHISHDNCVTRTQFWITFKLPSKLQFVIAIVFKVAVQILLCLKLEIPSWELPLYYVFIPLWCILAVVLSTITYHLIESVRSRAPISDVRFSTGMPS